MDIRIATSTYPRRHYHRKSAPLDLVHYLLVQSIELRLNFGAHIVAPPVIGYRVNDVTPDLPEFVEFDVSRPGHFFLANNDEVVSDSVQRLTLRVHRSFISCVSAL